MPGSTSSAYWVTTGPSWMRATFTPIPKWASVSRMRCPLAVRSSCAALLAGASASSSSLRQVPRALGRLEGRVVRLARAPPRPGARLPAPPRPPARHRPRPALVDRSAVPATCLRRAARLACVPAWPPSDVRPQARAPHDQRRLIVIRSRHRSAVAPARSRPRLARLARPPPDRAPGGASALARPCARLGLGQLRTLLAPLAARPRRRRQPSC